MARTLNFSFAGEAVVVTGGTSGIGLAIAQDFAKAGASVYATGLRPFPQDASEICFRELDVRDESAIKAFFREIGDVSILVNAAGVIRRDAEFELEVFEDVVNINLIGTMRMCMAARQGLVARKGVVVNVASMLSFFGGPRVPAYTATKGAVAQLTKSLAVAWAADGIRVNAIAPGWIATPLTEALQNNPERSAGLLGRTPMARWGKPDEVSPTVLFLCSDAASFLTGCILTVDGGYSAA
ncbi:MAG TPA: SDR family oxidoreductase [Bryobacteraceae bacterium]|nr:SDR family oxidoreductase [Bryobacteraceae bacterium]